MDRHIQVTFDAKDPHELARRWLTSSSTRSTTATLLQYQVDDGHDFVAKMLGDGLVTESDIVRINGRLFFAAVAASDPDGSGPPFY